MHQEHIQILFSPVLEFLNFSEDLLNTFDFSKISHLFNTKGSYLGLLKVSSVITKTYGLPPFQQSFPDTNFAEISYSNLRYLSRRFYLEKYMA